MLALHQPLAELVLGGVGARRRLAVGSGIVVVLCLLGLAGSYAAAWLSWTFVERPVLRRARGRAVSA